MSKRSVKKSAAWRELEQLIARIESAFSGKGVTVESPGRIKSLVTGRLREVDVILRSSIGTTPVVVAIECRRRENKQDITWIEQLACKRDAIGIAKLIAVSTSEFSQQARKAAEFYGIDLRILRSVNTDDEITSIFPKFIVHEFKSCKALAPIHVALKSVPGNSFDEEEKRKGGERRLEGADERSLLFRTSTGEMLTGDDIWTRADSKMNFWGDVPHDNKPHERTFVLTPEDVVEVDTPGGFRQVKHFRYVAQLQWKQELVPVNSAEIFSYDSTMPVEGKSFLGAEYVTSQGEAANLRISVHIEKGKSEGVVALQLLPSHQNPKA